MKTIWFFITGWIAGVAGTLMFLKWWGRNSNTVQVTEEEWDALFEKRMKESGVFAESDEEDEED